MKLRTAADFGAHAAERREHLGLTQGDVAERAGVTRDWIARFETGARNVTLYRVLLVYRALGLSVDARAEGHDG